MDVVNGEGFSQIPTVTRKRLTFVTKSSPRSLENSHFFGILSADFSEVGRQFSIKIPTTKYVQYASWRDIEVVITGLTRKRLTIVTLIYPQTLETLHFFGILSAEISEVGRQFSIKNPNQNLIRRDIEVVITGLTRNQFVRKHTRVRIPLSPPKRLSRT